MAELVEHDAAKQGQNESHPFQRLAHILARGPMAQNDEPDENQKRRVDVNTNAPIFPQFPRPLHVALLVVCSSHLEAKPVPVDSQVIGSR